MQANTGNDRTTADAGGMEPRAQDRTRYCAGMPGVRVIVPAMRRSRKVRHPSAWAVRAPVPCSQPWSRACSPEA